MNNIINALNRNPRVSGWKINIHNTDSYELFFVKGKLETLRCTDTCDKEVTVYVSHGEYLGDAQFFVYPSTTPQQLEERVESAVEKALLICNQRYELPGPATGDFQVDSNFAQLPKEELAAKMAAAIFGANKIPHASLNSVEIFLNRHRETVLNSRGLHKNQTRYTAMVETIPTYNGPEQSVELYHQYNFSSLDEAALIREISCKMEEVRARHDAITPTDPISCKVILNPEELTQIFRENAGDQNYAAVYSHTNLFSLGDAIQKDPQGDRLGLTMYGQLPGCVRSSMFDTDGMDLGSVRLVNEGKVTGYYGSNRYGQYLNISPTGTLRCMAVDPGSLSPEDFRTGPYLEIISMSGLQVDFYSDYIGGEIRLAYYHDGTSRIPVTGLSVSGKLAEVLNQIRFSRAITLQDAYRGPEKAIIPNMSIF